MSDINPNDLVELFRQAIRDKWGYIGGKAGIVWTEQQQAAVERAFRNGESDYENAAKYGRRWVGHRVSDCSGMFSWSFKELGGYMYHGSNTIWSKYTTNKGELKAGKRTDGEPLKPGTAVFKVNNGDYYHIGLYIGANAVIEAQGTRAGVVQSPVSNWHCWGELKGVDYDLLNKPAAEPVVTTATVATSAQPVTQTATIAKRGDVPMNNTNAVVSANGGVNMRSEPSTKSTRLATIPKDTRIKADAYDDTWSSVEYDGKKGYVMTRYLASTMAATPADNSERVMAIIRNIEKELAELKSLVSWG